MADIVKIVADGRGDNEAYRYPVDHWKELKRFATGEEYDPKGVFGLSQDVWDTWRYASNGRPTEAVNYRIIFRSMKSFLKLYVKLYCYELLMGKPGTCCRGLAVLPHMLAKADKFLLEHGYRSLEELVPSDVFQALWDAQKTDQKDEKGQLLRAATRRQEFTRPFWVFMSNHFGIPTLVPFVAAHKRRHPNETGLDESQIIPELVIIQLVNRLALHRDGEVNLSPYNHLRLCVLILVIILGRRIDEVLGSPRGTGPDGPLVRYPSLGGAPEGSLWFRFQPNKNGPANLVYISPEWEDITYYCVRSIIRYSDELRQYAVPEEHGLLILVSGLNKTANWHSAATTENEESYKLRLRKVREDRYLKSGKRLVTGLSQASFAEWVNGKTHGEKFKTTGIVELWGITLDGSAEGPLWKFKSLHARHTRQTIIAQDPEVPSLARQRDLNQRNSNSQLFYQHTIRRQNNALLEKIKKRLLVGKGFAWLSDIFFKSSAEHECKGKPDCQCTNQPPFPSRYDGGLTKILDPRWRGLINRNPAFLQANRVVCGYCTLPPGVCRVYALHRGGRRRVHLVRD